MSTERCPNRKPVTAQPSERSPTLYRGNGHGFRRVVVHPLQTALDELDVAIEQHALDGNLFSRSD